MNYNNIPDSILLAGLIAKTKPFEYVDNNITCNFFTHVDIEDLKVLKSNIQKDFDNIQEADMTDEIRGSHSNTMYFLETFIQELENK